MERYKLNQKQAREKGQIVYEVYDRWEAQIGNNWARWRILPMFVTVAKRQTPCEYCSEPIACGELRACEPTVHMHCFKTQMDKAMELYSEIKNDLIDRGMEKQNE